MAANHTFVMMQPTGAPASRTFYEYVSPGKAVEAIVQMFEARLKELNPNKPAIDYTSKDLKHYIDNLPFVGVLVFDQRSATYIPHDRAWIKERACAYLAQLMR